MEEYKYRELREGKPFIGEQFGTFIVISDPIEITVNDPVLSEANYRIDQYVKRGLRFGLEIRDAESILKPPSGKDPLNCVTTIGAKWVYFGRAWKVKRFQSKGTAKRVKKMYCGRRKKKIQRIKD